jgi:GntR family transcriptional regulator
MNLETVPIAQYHRIEIALAERIRNGFYADGVLPSERTLAAQFIVARVTVRHALRRLEEAGIVSRMQRQGTLIIHKPGTPPHRRLLREHIDQFLDSERPHQHRVLRFGLVPASAEVAEALNTVTGDPVLCVLRIRSRSNAPLTYTQSFIPGDLAHMIDRRTLAKTAVVQSLEKAGVKIGGASQAIRAERCPEEVAEALGVSAYEPVLRLERIAFDQAETPVHFLVGWYRADAFEVRMRMSRGDDTTRVWMQTPISRRLAR